MSFPIFAHYALLATVFTALFPSKNTVVLDVGADEMALALVRTAPRRMWAQHRERI